MRATIILLFLLTVAAVQKVAPETSSDRQWIIELISPASDLDRLRQQYLEDPRVNVEIKQAIERRVVILGMCPREAVAAAGLPRDGVLYNPGNRPVSTGLGRQIAAQCDHPDKESGVQLQFQNDTQFGPRVVFRVCFWEGRAVMIDQDPFIPLCWDKS